MGADVEQGRDHTRNWESVRTLLQSLILMGVVYLASTTKSNSDTNIELKTQMQTMTEEVRSLRGQLDNVQALAREIAKSDVRLDEHDRRIGTLEAAHVREAVRQAR